MERAMWLEVRKSGRDKYFVLVRRRSEADIETMVLDREEINDLREILNSMTS